MLIDTHGHVNFKAYKDDAKEVLQRALDNGVWVVNVGSQIDTSRQAVELANQFQEGVYATVGLHPEHTHSQYVDEEETHFKTREEFFNYEEYSDLAENPKVVGIGECGLDYYRLPEANQDEVIAKQKEAFRQQIRLAKEFNKALVVHSRPVKDKEDLYQDLIEILKSEGVENLRFEVHSFTGSPEAVKKFLELGAYVSFNGIITFDKTGNMKEVVKTTPLDRIILETDCPYLTPVPNRGKRNEPLFVEFVAKKLGEIKGFGVEKIADVTTANARKLFNI